MPSFKSRIRYSALALITALLLAFDFIVFFGFQGVLHTYVDSRLQAMAETWADIVGRNSAMLLDSIPEGQPRRTDGEHVELREAALSLRVLSLDGDVLWKGPAAAATLAVDSAILEHVRKGGRTFDTIRQEDGFSVRRIWIPIRQEGETRYVLQAETSLSLLERAMKGLTALLAAASVMILVLAWFGSNWLARQALTPVEILSGTAQKISEPSSLTTRLPLNAPYDEFRRLADAFNTMMDRLERVFEAQRQFVADAAHEIQTPLTALKGNLEVALRKNRRATEYRETLISNLAAVDRLNKLCRSLVTLARLTGQDSTLPTQAIALEPLLRELIDELTVLAEDRDVRMRLEADPALPIQGNKEQLQRLFINLLDNALRHTLPGGMVTVKLRSEGNVTRAAVADTGEGIESKHLPHIFERFYRADAARSRESGGVGLGLAIAKQIVEAHNGDISVSSDLGKGTIFTLRFPSEFIQ